MGKIRCAYASSSSSKNLFCIRAISFCSFCVKYNYSINFLFCPFLLVKQQIFYLDDELSFIKGQLQNADLIYRSISIQHPIYKFIQSTPSITLCRCCYFTLFLLLLLLHQDRTQKFGTVSRVEGHFSYHVFLTVLQIGIRVRFECFFLNPK